MERINDVTGLNYNEKPKNLKLIQARYSLQNYYYILQDCEWRQENDWIHIDSNGDIQSPLQAINNCKTKNIRLRTDCSGFSIHSHFDNETSKHLDKMRSISPATDLLKKVVHLIYQIFYKLMLNFDILSRIWIF